MIQSPTSRGRKLLVYTSFLFVGFLGHNYLQEKLMALNGFTFGSMLSFFEALGVLCCTGIERVYRGNTKVRKAPMQHYLALSILIAASSLLSNIALEYINYPVRVIFRSSKVIPTMLVGVLWMKARHRISEYLSAFMLSVGLILFAFADRSVSPQFSFFGIFLVSTSVCADAIVPNFQKKLFQAGADRGEVVFFSNVFAVGNMTAVSLLNGELFGFFGFILTNTWAVPTILTYMFVAYFAISTHVAIIGEFSAVTAVVLASARKALTILLSFILFPKPFSMLYLIGGLLVLTSLVWTSKIKSRPPPNKRRTKTSSGV